MATIKDLILKIKGDGSGFRRDLEEDKTALDAAMTEMDKKKADPNVKLKGFDLVNAMLTEISDKMDRLDGKTATVDVKENKRGGGLRGPAIAGGIASGAALASPIGASAIAGAMGLASAFSAAGAGAAGFGAVATGVLSNVFKEQTKLNKAQQAYNQATTKSGRQAALKKEKQAMNSLDGSQKQALKSLQNFEKFWNKFVKSFSQPVSSGFSNALKMLQNLLKDMRPAIEGAAKAFDTLLKDASQALESPFWKKFFNFLGQQAQPDIMAFGKIIGNLGKGFAALLKAFNPMAQIMLKGLVKLSKKFSQWATHLQSTKGFHQFINYVKQNGPKLLKTLGNLAKTVKNILVDLAPLGAQLLTILQHFSKWMAEVTKNHPHLVKFIAEAVAAGAAFKVFSGMISGILSPFTKMFGMMKKFGGISKLFSKDTKKTGKEVGIFKKGIQSTKKAIVNMSKKMMKSAKDGAKVGKDLIKKYGKRIGELAKEAKKSGKIMVKDFTNKVIDLGKKSIKTGKDIAQKLTAGVIDLGKQSIHGGKRLARGIISGVSNLAGSAVRAARKLKDLRIGTKLATAAQAAFNFVMDANPIGLVILGVAALAVGIYELIKHFKTVKRWAEHAWGAIRHFGSVIGNVLGNLWSKAYNWGSNMVSGFINGIENMLGHVGGAAKKIMDHIGKFIKFMSPAEEGPGRDIVKWGQNMIGGFIDGIHTATPSLRKALNHAMQPPQLSVSSNVAHMMRRQADAFGGHGSGGISSTNHTHNGPMLNIEHLHVQNQQDIDKIQQMLYETNEDVRRAQGE